MPPHGEAELAHPEKDFYAVGMKSYGRAPTFLMLTGYEQVRSIAAALTGDLVGAHRVELALPETGVCSTDSKRRSDMPTTKLKEIAKGGFIHGRAAAPIAASGCCGSSSQPDAGCCGEVGTAAASDCCGSADCCGEPSLQPAFGSKQAECCS